MKLLSLRELHGCEEASQAFGAQSRALQPGAHTATRTAEDPRRAGLLVGDRGARQRLCYDILWGMRQKFLEAVFMMLCEEPKEKQKHDMIVLLSVSCDHTCGKNKVIHTTVGKMFLF